METIISVLIALVIYDVVKWVIDLVWDIMASKPGLPNNRPTPLNRKSFKERLEEKQNEYANHHGHQPTNKVDTSNPPKQNKHDENI